MKLQRALRNYLRQHFPEEIHNEPWCTCGSGNHVRIFLFRVDSQPATVIVPEAHGLTADQLSHALGGAQVEPLAEDELDAIFVLSELGRMQPFENPFGTAIYLDAGVLQFETLVFCPRMFSGLEGECFRVPTKDFVALTGALTLPLVPALAAVGGA